MSKVWEVSTDEWYREIVPGSYYSEGDLERTLISYLSLHLPDYVIISCKMNVRNVSQKKDYKPDLVFVKKDYSEWYVVEVELSIHNLSHPLNQIETFCNGSYEEYHANFIYNKSQAYFDRDRLIKMVNDIPPKILIIINEIDSRWANALRPYNIKIAIFQIYFNEKHEVLLRFKGEFPVIKHKFCLCILKPGLPLFIQLDDNNFLDTCGVNEGDTISIDYNGRLCQWKRVSSRNKDYLECIERTIPLDTTTLRYSLIIDDVNSQFYFKTL